MFSDFTPDSHADTTRPASSSALPSSLKPNTPPSPSALILPNIYPGSLFGAPLSTIPELTTSSSEPSRLGLSHPSSLQQPLTKLRIPPLSLRHNPVAGTSATSQTDSSPAPQTPESATPIAPSPTRSFKDLKACLQRPAEESKGKEDTWQDAMRGGFLTFSSNL